MGVSVAVLLLAQPHRAARVAGHLHASLLAAVRMGAAVAVGIAVYVPLAGRGWLRRRSGGGQLARLPKPLAILPSPEVTRTRDTAEAGCSLRQHRRDSA